ncbi:glycosyltransferase [Tropicimonas sp. IMCC6043]|uniref:glycosyltransferase n=1 Tax=Tropicimonas sp. IMCC6043 TaxID=2510645 RepID=UPI00101BE9CD|nr:glycosyltransferase [Tropicimonas sp. IMCC6043]RYH12335.1 glycosyltransferase [Tropicimonas sp. IMCC6043]
MLRGHRYVYDLDDADFHDPKLTVRMERDVAEFVGVIAGSRYIARWCRQFQPNTRIVWTCARPIEVARPDHRDRAPTIVWAQSQPEGYPAEFEFVTGVMEALARRRKGVRLRLYGDGAPGESDHVARLEAAGVTVEWMPFMEYGAFVRSLCDMSVGLAPLRPQAAFSRGKSFGKILAYLDAGVPVIASDEVDNALLFESGSGVVSNDPEVWVAEIDRLLDAPEIRNEMSRKADRIYRQRLSVDVAVDLVEAFLLDCLDRESPSG